MAQTMPAKALGAELISINPATGEEIGRAPLTMPEDVARAVGRARSAANVRKIVSSTRSPDHEGAKDHPE